jgi:hypothetical protein
MKQRTQGRLAGLALGIAAWSAQAQTELPQVNVVGPKWEARHGGYVISSNFNVDPKMSAVIYPAEPFQPDDIFDFRTVKMSDEDYFVLQECSSADCSQAHVLQVWTRNGALNLTSREPNRFRIPHEGKIFMWMQHFPMAGWPEGGRIFAGFDPSSPPLVLNPQGTPEQLHSCDVKAAQDKGPVKVTSSEHDGTQLKLSFETGSVVFIQRMHAAE